MLFERHAKRSIQLYNLPDGTAHSDVTAAIRGGLVLDIFLRNWEKSVTVSFLREEDARAFHNHVRKNDLYIKNKRVSCNEKADLWSRLTYYVHVQVEIKWSDRQYVLLGHIAHKIGAGATRNLVIKHCDPNHTEESIRDDLEHIHNLVVISVLFLGGDCFISTNSVANAMYARTCMMSRR